MVPFLVGQLIMLSAVVFVWYSSQPKNGHVRVGPRRKCGGSGAEIANQLAPSTKLLLALAHQSRLMVTDGSPRQSAFGLGPSRGRISSRYEYLQAMPMFDSTLSQSHDLFYFLYPQPLFCSQSYPVALYRHSLISSFASLESS